MDDQEKRLLLEAIARVNGHSHPKEWAQAVLDELEAGKAQEETG